ncbi:MAG: 50S ribosomal protein L11 methyltransferase [Verrucomicrobiae bacterium]|nr:50S ribosomal protein L11 methyltransferase [Verrucomicrobiae bacterium]
MRNLQQGYLWRKRSQFAESWIPFLEKIFGDRVVLTQEPHRKTGALEIYLKNETEGKILQKNLGGRVLFFDSKQWAKWQRAAHYPIKIENQLLVVASEKQRDFFQRRYPKRKILWIPAEAAFGTGAHATTFLCLREMIKCYPFASLVDAGTGSGILAIAAAQLGCKKVQAFDSDPVAIRVAKQNAQRNRVNISWNVKKIEHFQPKQKVDGVVANLFSEILIHRSKKIANWIKKDGFLILSGIRSYQRAEVQKAFSFLTAKEIFQKEGWCGMVFQK